MCIGPYDQQSPSLPAAYEAIHQCFRVFSEQHPIAPEYLHTLLVALSKGTHLVKAALAWEDAAAGPTSTRSTAATKRARGEQWRLVMAHGGLEMVSKALLFLRCPHVGMAPEEAARLTDLCELPPYVPLEAPNRRRAELAKWLEMEVDLGEHPMVDFLGMHGGGAKVFRRWAVEGRPIESWVDAMQLAKALRHATAHGALSAMKVRQWGLRDAMETLNANLGEITAAALRRLTEPSSHRMRRGQGGGSEARHAQLAPLRRQRLHGPAHRS